MKTLIFKTNIESDTEFRTVRKTLSEKKRIEDCTIDFDDVDKVLRILTYFHTVSEIEEEIQDLGFYCKEMDE
jgi:hypothetical protein